jgi:hypothetical protein
MDFWIYYFTQSMAWDNLVDKIVIPLCTCIISNSRGGAMKTLILMTSHPVTRRERTCVTQTLVEAQMKTTLIDDVTSVDAAGKHVFYYIRHFLCACRRDGTSWGFSIVVETCSRAVH